MLSGSICKSGLSVHNSHRLKEQRISSIKIALCLQSVAVVNRQATFTDTSTKISSMEVALCLQSVADVDRQAIFTDTSTRISSVEIALCLRTVVD